MNYYWQFCNTSNKTWVEYFQQIFWPGLAVNAHLPSTVFPTGLSSDGLPIGLQVIGGAYEDKTTIKFAELYEEEFKAFVAPNLV